MAKSFIKTDLNSWGLAEDFDESGLVVDSSSPSQNGIPFCEGVQLPVISCIGSSRDGKSTLLNIIHKCLTDSDTSPFEAKNGGNMVTNGINYVDVPDKCILLDCQGFALKNAKYDHYVALVAYHLSNVVILNVRQRLDLQVMSNLLGVFSFLSEIPEEYRRKNKPYLVIRIKDFQEFDLMDADPRYLTKYVDSWLEKSDDQYDHVKDAFRASFNIEVMVTEYPVFSQKHGVLDIHDPDFSTKNPSFISVAQKIIGFATIPVQEPNKLLTNKDFIRAFIKDLRENKNIDYKKFDIYHNITSLELMRYASDHMIIAPYNDKTLVNKMDGSREASLLYVQRKEEIERLRTVAYDHKFKDVTLDVKNEIFGKLFDSFQQIVDSAQKRNEKLAERKVAKYVKQFDEKYKETIDEDFSQENEDEVYQCVAFIYGGSIIKASHVYLFAVKNGNVVKYVRKHLVRYFGGSITGRYVKCEDAEATLASVYDSAEEKEYIVDADCKNILKCNVGEATDLLKTVANVNVAHSIKLTKNDILGDSNDKADGEDVNDECENEEDCEEDYEEYDEETQEESQDQEESLEESPDQEIQEEVEESVSDKLIRILHNSEIVTKFSNKLKKLDYIVAQKYRSLLNDFTCGVRKDIERYNMQEVYDQQMQIILQNHVASNRLDHDFADVDTVIRRHILNELPSVMENHSLSKTIEQYAHMYDSTQSTGESERKIALSDDVPVFNLCFEPPKGDEQAYWERKNRLLTNKVFLPKINFSKNTGIHFVVFNIKNKRIIMTNRAFSNMWIDDSKQLESWFRMYSSIVPVPKVVKSIEQWSIDDDHCGVESRDETQHVDVVQIKLPSSWSQDDDMLGCLVRDLYKVMMGYIVNHKNITFQSVVAY